MMAETKRRARRVGTIALLLVSAWPFAISAQLDSSNVLLLAQPSGADNGQRYMQALRSQLQAGADTKMFGEMFNFNQISDTGFEPALAKYLTDTYSDADIDLVIAVGGAPLRFLLANRANLFVDVPVAFSAVPGYGLNTDALPANVTGIMGHFNISPTVELARRLQPEADRIVLVAGSSSLDQTMLRAAQTELNLYRSRIDFETLTGLTIEDTERRLAALPTDTIVIVLMMLEDAAGRRFAPINVATARLAAASAAPVYGVYETQMGDGIVGVVGDDLEALGSATGEMAAALLTGKSPSEMPPRFGNRRTLVDSRQLQRFQLDESLLPPEAEVRYREPTLWQQYRNPVIGIAALVVFQFLLILALLLRSRQRRAERNLERSEARYREVLEAQDDAVCRFSPDGTLTFVNDALCRRFGLAREDLIGRQYMDLLPEPRRSMAIERIRKMVAKPETRAFDLEVRNADGSTRWEHWVERPVLDENGQVIEIQGMARDVTQLKDAERESRIQNERITHLTRVAILGEFSGALAHELNQPLTAIMSDAQAAQILLSQNRADADELKEIMDDIVSNNRRARDVITGLRKLLRGRTAEPTVIDVNDLVRSVLALVRSVTIDKNIVVSTDLAGELPSIRGDEVQLQQVLLNLFMNATEAVSGNDRSDRYIWVVTEYDPSRGIRVGVKDNGPGIELDIQGRLFEPYFTTKHEGLGLGLSICRSIVESHGGRLILDTQESSGACFEFVLPPRADADLDFEADEPQATSLRA
jgi:PAS domain S-box-containing protein